MTMRGLKRIIIGVVKITGGWPRAASEIVNASRKPRTVWPLGGEQYMHIGKIENTSEVLWRRMSHKYLAA